MPAAAGKPPGKVPHRKPRRGPRTPEGRPRPAPYEARPAEDRAPSTLDPGGPATPHHYLLFYKPYGVLSSFTDPEGRPALGDYIHLPDVYAAGRLDQDSEGLMLLTDDGWLSHRLTHPRHHQPKTYLVQVEGIPDEVALAALRAGVPVKGERTEPAEAELLRREPDLPPRAVPIRYRPSIPTAWLRLVLREGRKRQIRHMTAAVGYPTLRLVRTAIGPLTLGTLQPGEWRKLTPTEVVALRRAVTNWK